MDLEKIFKKSISWLFIGLFFLVPLFFTSVNSELFEFNKIILVYAFTILIVGVWFARMILARQILFKRTFLDIPLVLFLLSQIASTIFSIDPHTSIFGYYSRFNGGLLSTISYIFLYWAFVSNCESEDVKKIVKFSLISGAIVSFYGILEHFGHSFSCLMFGTGFNVDCWVQKVQERVFATFGQPNWLAAYLAVLAPLTWSFALVNFESRIMNKGKSLINKPIIHYSLFIILFMCLLFTQSRSGFLGFVLSFVVFWGTLFFINKKNFKSFSKPLILNTFFLILLVVIFGSPFSQINKYFTLSGWRASHNSSFIIHNSTQPSSLDGGISESGDIRKIVWKGAIDIFKHYPILGSGVETFAYSYYQFRPIEHNLVSEWDFLYNKAHNEYLNYLSTTGLFGLGTYLFFILSFVVFNVKSIKYQVLSIKEKDHNTYFLILTSLFSGWLSLLITNFFGFSVVVTSLYFFLIPAFVIVISQPPKTSHISHITYHISPFLLFPLFFIFYFLFFILRIWRADYFYNQGLKTSKSGQYDQAYQYLFKASRLSPKEPVILSELSSAAASLAYLSFQNSQTTETAEFFTQAIDFSNQALNISPKNLNLHKTKIKVSYTLSNLDPQYLPKTIQAALEAIKLSPTDPKLVYNLGLLYGKAGDGLLAIQTIEKAVEMKPNYVDGRNALSIFYADINEKQKALDQLQILLQLAPENKADFEKRIENLK